MLFLALTKRVKRRLILQAIAMLMGASTHLSWVLQHGFLAEAYGKSMASRLFWDSLTFLDPLAAGLLIFKPKFGLLLTLSIICVDVIHNHTVYFDELYDGDLTLWAWISYYWMIIGQTVFCLWVVATFKSNWRELALMSRP